MRYVLLLQGHCASAFAVGRRDCGAPVVFENSVGGRGRFRQYLLERQGTLFTVVLDSKDEEHHLESIPRLRHSDREKILSRLRQRYFTGDSLSVVTMEKAPARGTRNMPVTISGVGVNSDCECWLELLRNSSTLIVALSSLSLLGLLVHRALGQSSGICAVQLGLNDFRIMAFNNSRIVISRHVSFNDTQPTDLPGELLEQLQSTQNYLGRLVDVTEIESNNSRVRSEPKVDQLIQDRQGVWVIGAVSAKGRSLLEKNNVRVSSCRSVAKVLKLRHEITSPFGDSLFAAVALLGHARHTRYSPGVYRNSIKERRARQLLFAGIFCCLGVSAAATAAAVRVGQTYSSLATTVNRMSSDYAENIRQVSMQGDDLELPVDAIRESMNLVSQLDSRSRYTPQHFLYSFAADLSDFPELEITTIHWSRVESNYSNSMSDGNAVYDIAAVESEIYYSANVTGYIHTKGIARVTAVNRFNNFISRLIDTGSYNSVRVLEAPFGIADSSVTTGGGQHGDQEEFIIALDARPVVQP